MFGEIELDESSFGGHRKGKRGRGAAGKFPVFGLFKRGGKVYAKVIPDVKGKTLKAIIDTRVVPDSIVYSDTLSSYVVLDVSAFKQEPLRPNVEPYMVVVAASLCEQRSGKTPRHDGETQGLMIKARSALKIIDIKMHVTSGYSSGRSIPFA